MQGGYVGRVLMVDLSSWKVTTAQVSEDDCRDFVGGSGLGAKMLVDLESFTGDSLEEKRPLIFMTGPATGTRVPLSGRHAVVARSPLTGIFGESDVGGAWGFMLKRAGFDGIVVRGKSRLPVYIWVKDGNAEIRPAEHLWGRDVYETDRLVRDETCEDAVTGAIGQAGEKLVKISAIAFDGRHARVAGRCGLGAVMGSKNLKAIAVYGQRAPQVAHPDALARALAGRGSAIASRMTGMRDFGTGGGIVSIEKRGDLPVHNWLLGRWEEGAQNISGQRMAQTILTGRYFCRACPVGCGREVKVSDGVYAPVDGAGPEYETLGMFGGCCEVTSLEAIARANELCNRYGIDTISTGAVIAMAMEAYEKGLITRADTGGMELLWGDAGALLWLVERIGTRTGIGELLGEGARAFARELGPEADEMAIHVKGLELPAHDPRGHYSLAVGYATSNRGACHLQAFSHNFDVSLTMPDIGITEVQGQFRAEGKGELVAKLQNLMCVFDSLKICKFAMFGGVTASDLALWLSLVTGWDYDVTSLMEVGDRIFNLKRMYNVRLGISRKDDTLPRRILSHPRGEGFAASTLPPLEPMLEEYYRFRKWDANGIPKPETLERLGIGWLVPTEPGDGAGKQSGPGPEGERLRN
ncbi:MAG: aldehyde ferredoxin oxidoreductase family protein [Firmicutes bacterium]|nr:aldehyde ferredoxin oxidoreductase family protein [Bacillota bacterium]